MFNDIKKVTGKRESGKNWFDTLNEALESEGLLELWPLGRNIAYGETSALTVEHNGEYRYISVYRSEMGRYERPIAYSAGKIK